MKLSWLFVINYIIIYLFGLLLGNPEKLFSVIFAGFLTLFAHLGDIK